MWGVWTRWREVIMNEQLKETANSTAEAPDRQDAIERLRAKRDLSKHLIVFAVVNAAVVVIWVVTGAGYFWPVWLIAGWGIALLLHAWEVYGQRPITEDDIQREMRRHSSS
jgi:hypothetical protein